MRQTIETKQKLDAILKAFGDYIREQDFFDIVYSEKVGYICILARNLADECPEWMDTPERLLGSLFNDIINDAIFSPDNSKQEHEHLTLTEYEETECRRRITAILKTMEGEDAAHYLDFLDTYIKAYQEDGARRRAEVEG
ncbi:MAG: hypothetical protein HFF73_12500 [Oscillospiraceae bacterium]|jgi:hypothetical protein|nr:hypothetical protein [Oscillospiraceae bacterium]